MCQKYKLYVPEQTKILTVTELARVSVIYRKKKKKKKDADYISEFFLIYLKQRLVCRVLGAGTFSYNLECPS